MVLAVQMAGKYENIKDVRHPLFIGDSVLYL